MNHEIISGVILCFLFFFFFFFYIKHLAIHMDKYFGTAAVAHEINSICIRNIFIMS